MLTFASRPGNTAALALDHMRCKHHLEAAIAGLFKDDTSCNALRRVCHVLKCNRLAEVQEWCHVRSVRSKATSKAPLLRHPAITPVAQPGISLL